MRALAALAALALGIGCSAPLREAVVENRTPDAVAYQFLAAAAAYTVRTAPRVATAEACVPPVCSAEHGDAALGPWDDRHRPFTFAELDSAAMRAGFEPPELIQILRLIVTCENVVMDAGIVNREAGPRPEHWAYGAAQVQLGWFDKAGIPREMWPSLTHNLRAAKAARDEAVRLGLPPFYYWACRA